MSQHSSGGTSGGPIWRPTSQQREWSDQHRQPPPPPSYGESHQYSYPPQTPPVPQQRPPPPPSYRQQQQQHRPPTSLTMRIPPFSSSGDPYGQPPPPPSNSWYDQRSGSWHDQQSGSWHDQQQPPPPQYPPRSYPPRQQAIYSYDDRPYMPMHSEQVSPPYPPPTLTPRQSHAGQPVQIQFRPTGAAAEKRDYEAKGDEQKQLEQHQEQPPKRQKREEDESTTEATIASTEKSADKASDKTTEKKSTDENTDADTKSKDAEAKKKKDNLSLLAKVSFAMHTSDGEEEDAEGEKGGDQDKSKEKDAKEATDKKADKESESEAKEKESEKEVKETEEDTEEDKKKTKETEKKTEDEDIGQEETKKETEKPAEETEEMKAEKEQEKEVDADGKAKGEDEQKDGDEKDSSSPQSSMKIDPTQQKEAPLSPVGGPEEQKVETPKSSNKSPTGVVRTQLSRQVTPVEQRRHQRAGSDNAAYQRSVPMPRDFPRPSRTQRGEYPPYSGYSGTREPPEGMYARHDYPPTEHHPPQHLSPSRYSAAPTSPNYPYSGPPPPPSRYRDPHEIQRRPPPGWEPPRAPPPDPSVWRRPTYEHYHEGTPVLVQRGSSYEDEQQPPRGPRSPGQYYHHYPREYPPHPASGGEWSETSSAGHPPPYYSRPEGPQYHDSFTPPSYTSPSDPRARQYPPYPPHPGTGEPPQVTPPSHQTRPKTDSNLYQTAPYTYVQQPRLEEKTLLRKKFSWKHYPELERFLIANRDEYLRHSALNYTAEQKQYNNWLTERLLEVAAQHHYEFDPKEFNFVAVRDRIRCYYKSYVQTARKRGLPIQGSKTPSSKTKKQQQEPQVEVKTEKEGEI